MWCRQYLWQGHVVKEVFIKTLNLAYFTVALPLLLLAPSTAFADAASDAAACDALAASTRDTERPANVPGVAFDDVKGQEAIAACTIAFASNPDSARIAFELGRAYDTGDKEPEKQYQLYKIAADKGYVIGLYNFARLHERRGAHLDQAIANSYHCKAAEAGFDLAFVACGYAYDHGVGAPKDGQKAHSWYQKGADSGDATALADLG